MLPAVVYIFGGTLCLRENSVSCQCGKLLGCFTSFPKGEMTEGNRKPGNNNFGKTKTV